MVVEKDKTEECYRILEAEANKLIESGEYDPLEIAGVMCAQAIKIYSDSFGQDEKFFKFYRSMLAYENTFSDDGTTMLLSPDSDFFSFFGNQSGN